MVEVWICPVDGINHGKWMFMADGFEDSDEAQLFINQQKLIDDRWPKITYRYKIKDSEMKQALNRVTLTGADDTVTNFGQLIDLSKRYPFVEWGILASESQQGGHRFPSKTWIDSFAQAVTLSSVNATVCIHVCGKWVREICRGNWQPLYNNVGPILSIAKRIQLNFHAYKHLVNDNFYSAARRQCGNNGWQIIFQVDGVNDHLVSNAIDEGINAVPLYDKSGGAGVVPEEWPKQMAGVYSGYAGGLGPDNVISQLNKIDAAACSLYWIDMESRLYDGHNFDLGHCENVLRQCLGHVGHLSANS